MITGNVLCIGERNRGWQFGENMRTQKMGWFPVAYTEVEEKAMMLSEMKAGPSPVPPPMPPPVPTAARA